MAFPTSLDTFTFPAAGDSLNTVGVLHTDQHGSANSAISALEARVGIDNSTNTTSLNYKVCSAASIDPGHHHTNTAIDSLAVSKLVTGGYRMAYFTASGNVSATYAHDLIRCSGAITAVLPGASGLGKVYHIKNISGTTLISASGSNTIDGGATAFLNTQYQSMTLVDVSGNWDII